MRKGVRSAAGIVLALFAACSPRRQPSLTPVAPSGWALPPIAGAPRRVTAFIDVGVVPMNTDEMWPRQTVLVEGGRITAVGPVSDIPVPSGAQRIEGRGKFLLPGLADCHAHLTMGSGLGFGLLIRSFADSVLLEHRLFLWLASGMTTIRNMDHGMRFPLGGNAGLLRLRGRAAAGELWSPRIYTAAMLSGPDGGPLLLRDVAPAVAAYKAAGFDFIKIHLNYRHGEVYDSLVAASHHAGLPIDGHVNGVTTLDRALQDYRSIEHLTGYEEAALAGDSAGQPRRDSTGSRVDRVRVQALAEATRRAGVWNCPTLYNAIRNADMMGESGKQHLDFEKSLLRSLQQSGARLLLGSDRTMLARVPHPPGEQMNGDQLLDMIYGDADAIHRELQVMVEAGLTPYQALVTGTRNVAAFFGTLDESGTIELGKRADLLLLDGNPLEDIHHTRHPAGVMIGGRWLDRATIDRRVEEIKAWWLARCRVMTLPGGDKLPC